MNSGTKIHLRRKDGSSHLLIQLFNTTVLFFLLREILHSCLIVNISSFPQYLNLFDLCYPMAEQGGVEFTVQFLCRLPRT